MKNKLMNGYSLIVVRNNQELKGVYITEDLDLIGVESKDLTFLEEEKNIMNCLDDKKAFSLAFNEENDKYVAMIKVKKDNSNTNWINEYAKEGNGIEQVIIDLNNSIVIKGSEKGEKIR